MKHPALRTIRNLVPLLTLALFLHGCIGDGVRAERDENLAFGIDVSQYQGKINWSKVGTRHPIEYVIVRTTMGKDGVDSQAKRNLKGAKDAGFKIGVYHYYRPNENSSLQARHFLDELERLDPDLDFRVVLDIEETPDPQVQTVAQLKVGLKNWLNIVEDELGHHPIIYTGFNFYEDNFEQDDDFEKYPFWIASYNSRRRDAVRRHFDMHQFTDQVRVGGISEYVDGNDIDRDAMNDYLRPEKVQSEELTVPAPGLADSTDAQSEPTQ